ncbi:MAG: glycogen/starch/alpha-glucan phosphorylase [Clostridiales bacterium]|nr:glycogen/starch/alpha-glucan phosphorylase [Clostridiales bacterium]
MFNKDNFREDITQFLLSDYGTNIENTSSEILFNVVSKAIMAQLMPIWMDQSNQNKRQAYYFSAEFLMGRAFSNNLINLNVINQVKEIMRELQIDFNLIEDSEMDAGLGNGGLGRLAACFLDSAATHDIPLQGYGIRYKYGLFKQTFSNGFQSESADEWLINGDPWSIRKFDESTTIAFSDFSLRAVPYDVPIIGYQSSTINTLRLWQAEPIHPFNFEAFNNQDYNASTKEKNMAEDISRVLYPNDSNDDGKLLRIRQEYFLSSASLKDLVRSHKKTYGHLTNFHETHAIQLNDTHPAVSIPEFIRLLVDEENFNFEDALKIAQTTFSYTNHTILSEALEQWNVDYFKRILPRIYQIIEMIDDALQKKLTAAGLSLKNRNYYKIINNGKIKMAWISIFGSHSVNGVAELHTEILIKDALKPWYAICPQKFQNKTNGITQRRWLLKSNPELSSMITRLLETDAWIKKLSLLGNLNRYATNNDILNEFIQIKRLKKEQLADYIYKKEDFELDVNSIFDIQIKRLHEYKRQLLNAFHILDLYYRLKENPELKINKRSFIFGAKSAPGYFRAKGIIKFINEVAKLVNNDSSINNQIKVIFVQNYDVTYGEKLFPAADLSEQISTAGKEASGTGNMKFMLNGTPTIGTFDGANVEIVEEAGFENNFIFGARVEELAEINTTYDPHDYYINVEGLKRVVDSLIDGTFDDEGTGMFKDIYDSLLIGDSWQRSDSYFILKDFESYREAQNKADEMYNKPLEFAKMAWTNMAAAGKFSSDRTVLEYSKEIWKL